MGEKTVSVLTILAYLATGASGCSGTSLEGDADTSMDPALETETDVMVDTATDPPPDCSVDGEIDASRWIIRLGGEEDERPTHITTSPEGHLLLSGWHLAGTGYSHAWFVEIDGAGNVISQQASADVIGRSIPDHHISLPSTVPLRDCGRLLVAATQTFGFGGSDVWLARLDAAGTILWQVALGGTGHEWRPAAIETRDGGIFVVSNSTESIFSSEFYLWLVLLDSSGAIVWQKQIDDDEIYFRGPGGLLESDAGTFIVASETRAGPDGPDVWVLEVDPSGELVRQVLVDGGSMHPYMYLHEALVDGPDVILAGHISSPGGGSWLARLAPSGELTWQRAYTTNEIRGASLGSDGSILVAGQGTVGDSGGYIPYAWLASIDDRGDIVWQRMMSDIVGDMGGDGLALAHAGGIVIATKVDTPSSTATIVASLDAEGGLSGDCWYLGDVLATSEDTFAATSELDVAPVYGFGGVAAAYATFFDPEMQVHTLCTE